MEIESTSESGDDVSKLPIRSNLGPTCEHNATVGSRCYLCPQKIAVEAEEDR